MNGEATAHIHAIVMPATLGLLPAKMDSVPARAMLLAIGLQESRFVYRKQVGGPARSFWQFETAGVLGVLSHAASRPHIIEVLQAMGYDRTVAESHEAIAHNDILACAYARLLLWTSPRPLPQRDDAHGAWNYYLNCWRPGKPRGETWNEFYTQAWQLAETSP